MEHNQSSITFKTIDSHEWLLLKADCFAITNPLSSQYFSNCSLQPTPATCHAVQQEQHLWNGIPRIFWFHLF